MSNYVTFRENGYIKFKFPNGKSISIDNNVVTDVSISGTTDINIKTGTDLYLVYKADYTLFKGVDGVALGSTPSEVVSSLESILTSSLDLGEVIKPDLSAGKSETTNFVHGDSIANGGAVILSTESAKIGVQGNHIEFDSTGTYGDIDINVKTPSGNTDRAIHIFGTALQQAPTIEFEGPIIISASNGNRYYLKVSNTGGLYTEAV
jgi:hypothetical protein